MSKYQKHALFVLLLVLFFAFLTEFGRTATITGQGRTKLSWEHTTEPHPERGPWSDHLLNLVQENFSGFDKGKDWNSFCPNWNQLSYDQKTVAISEMIIAVIYFESGYRPTSRMIEEGLGNDPYTGAQVASEGLLQLSYGDKKWAPWCEFNYQADRYLPLAKRSILDPIKNLSCGVRIMANQVYKNKAIVISKNAYWSVLKAGHRNQKINQIKYRTKTKAPGCA